MVELERLKKIYKKLPETGLEPATFVLRIYRFEQTTIQYNTQRLETQGIKVIFVLWIFLVFGHILWSTLRPVGHNKVLNFIK